MTPLEPVVAPDAATSVGGFQWFVAWRYLMARPRRWSKAILWVAVVPLIGAACCFAVGRVSKKSDPTRFFPELPDLTYRGPLIRIGLALFVIATLWRLWLRFPYYRTIARSSMRELVWLGMATRVIPSAVLVLFVVRNVDPLSIVWAEWFDVGYALDLLDPLYPNYRLALFIGGVSYVISVAAIGSLWLTNRAAKVERPQRPGERWWWVTTALLVGSAACVVASQLIGIPNIREPMLALARGLAQFGELALALWVIRYYFSFFTTVSIAGVAIGTMALVIVLSVMSGFEADLRQKILGSNAHVLITKIDGELTEYREVEAKLDGIPGLIAHTPYESSEVVLVANSNYANVVIKGIVPQTIGKVTDLERNLDEKSKDGLGLLYPITDADKIDDQADDHRLPGDHEGRPGVDPPPDDLNISDDAPIDFSGGSAGAGSKPGSGRVVLPPVPRFDRVDPAPADLAVSRDPPIDFSGGHLGDSKPRRPSLQADLEAADLDPPGVSPRVAALSGVLVGRELVKQLHLYVGQEVRLVSPLSDPANPSATPIPYTRNVRVAGTFFTGMYEYDLKLVYVELGALQQFLDLGDQVQGIEVRVADPQNPGPQVAAIERAIGPDYLVQDWQQLNRNLFAALKLEKIMMFIVLAIIILVASFSIIGNLTMVVVEKAKEIALLKTLGASNTGIMQVFITQGFFIGAVGTVIGVAHGLLICWIFFRFGLPLNPDVYYIDQMPIHVESSSVVAVLIAGVAISILATIYPAGVAARMRPVEGLRHQ